MDNKRGILLNLDKDKLVELVLDLLNMDTING